MSDVPRGLTRDDLRRFLPNARAVRAFEQLLKQSDTTVPTDITQLQIDVAEASADAQSGISTAQLALTALEALRLLLDLQVLAPPVIPSVAEDVILPPLVPSVAEDVILPPLVPSVAEDAALPPVCYTTQDLADVQGDRVGGQLFVFDGVTNSWRATTLLQLASQVATPSATGFNVTVVSVIGSVTYNIWLLLKPAAAYAAGTITLPAVASCLDQQEVTVSCSQQVVALTVAGNGATVKGAPGALAADSTFKLRYNLASTTWHLAT